MSSTGLHVDAMQVASAGPAHPGRLALWKGVLLPGLVGLGIRFVCPAALRNDFVSFVRKFRTESRNELGRPDLKARFRHSAPSIHPWRPRALDATSPPNDVEYQRKRLA